MVKAKKNPKKQIKHTQINTSTSNTHILNKIKTLYSGELFWLVLFITGWRVLPGKTLIGQFCAADRSGSLWPFFIEIFLF